jgi:putative ABC transport system ATP-binding protein
MVLVVTHDHRLVPYADRVFELADGQMRNEGSPAQVLGKQHGARPETPHLALPFRKPAPRLQLYVPQPAALA